ncbi:glycoside hydrolase family 27 protein [Aureobasidium subglaciale EXF-2481]|uniref:Alpha-galactosidase n=1 Tax=Aureobasidium subglaciale (strain EXF-2481) TaxID=1043005 RepID=A0A074YCG3_AURSE|nr:glycoside hydrolase family 27 protein [Aureobasidium subglaciale EXF-2481]KEQ93704.1 glycoside hydrolase family 27 protein [Aureobasidium subglaciale EXF-2481]
MLHSVARLAAITALPLTLASPTIHKRLANGLAPTPPMGWNSYNHYNCAPNQSIIQSNADALVNLGLADLGYTYVTTDCGWTIPDRGADGKLTWNETLFPSGFPAVGQYIHDLGLGFGTYSDGGVLMCAGGINQTGSLGFEYTDAEIFASWGADLLKYDNC